MRINKKAIVENFLALIISAVIIGIIFFLLFFFMYAKVKADKAEIASDLNIKEGLYTTRIVLAQEVPETSFSEDSTDSTDTISSNSMQEYKLYNSLINSVNSGSYDSFKADAYLVLSSFYPAGEIGNRWVVIINDDCFVFAKAGETDSKIVVQSGSQFGQGAGMSQEIYLDDCDSSIIDKMPKLTVPNPDGENILVLIKPSSTLDGETSRVFGYRADLLNGVSTSRYPDYSVDGKELEEIEGIPNVVCDESDTSVGKICIADSDLVQQLKLMSAQKLQEEDLTLVITQAYRTYEIQKALYDQNCNENGECKTITCNPDLSSICPHMQAGAVDVYILNSKGERLSAKKTEEIMCSYGFVRYAPETWHFEYGTYQWNIAVEKRRAGEDACTYGSTS